jgi:hypothetical protein
VSANFQRPPDDAEALALLAPGGLDSSPTRAPAATPDTDKAPPALSSLPVGARLVLRCRKDWRVATVSAVDPFGVRLNVASPSGHTYRVRRPADSALTYEGPIPLLGAVTAAGWRAALARYDARW